MPFIAPQLASPLPADWSALNLKGWVMEEKFDGHRLIVEVGDGLNSLLSDARHVKAWSRYGKTRELPPHLAEQLGRLPAGIFDGELLVPNHRSYGVTERTNIDRLCFVAFDVLEVRGTSVMDMTLSHRREMLQFIFTHPGVRILCPNLKLAAQRPCVDHATVHAWRDEVWARDGEGLILKKLSETYVPGKRPKTWIKIKQLRTAVVRVVGWQPSKGKILARGQFAVAVVEDDDGNTTTVKTKDDATIISLELEARRRGRAPFIHRRLRIEYQERTPDGSYRHPRWDRWEDE